MVRQKVIVFGYDFPHWKTTTGLFNMCVNGFKPDLVVLQKKKELTVPHSNYRVTPKGEYLQEPREVCELLGIEYVRMDHDTDIGNPDLGIILGARILKKETIERFTTGILNIHPGILPGNRGLDNLKHSIAKDLPIGVTAHLIDHRIDMGTIIKTETVPVYEDDTIRDVYIRQRNLEQKVLIEVLKANVFTGTLCDPSEKFTAIDSETDNNIEELFEGYKQGCYPEYTINANQFL